MAVYVRVQALPGRHAPDGQGDRVPASYWIAAAGLTLAVVSHLPLGRPAAIAVATIVFIGGGLPHGAYDIALLRRAAALDRRRLSLVVAGYAAIVGAMALMWTTMPLFALILFLVVASIHFGEDWGMIEEPLLRVAAGAAIIAAPTIGHPGAVTRLFVAMSDDRAGVLVRVVIAIAPVALLITAVGIAVAWRSGSRNWATAMASCLLLLVAAPPVAGFALFFVFLHSPRHLAATRIVLRDMTLLRWLATGGALSATALFGWWMLQRMTIAPVGDITAGAFQLLASVAVPHLLLSRWLDRRLERTRSAVSG
ncbi:Brp/Blh family beta-carotene 15,15'-dioxygenase [Sphingomonas bacterium]|uniref:Brp/Blh family beta-carotene 15,15'-dioxygenase n=1 Tax=Sphingomonas bacterium TaxID=1895847 RepID=UPI001576D7FD|nr:Brp/Blh family beta-carotene 15,15'-dioxygenase [Sphingomonas bacterium]